MLLSIHNLSASVQGKQILKKINLSIEQGTIHAIIGQNGTGKTTLSNAIMGTQQLDVNGEILFNNENITNNTITERAQKGITLGFQHPPSFEGITVRQYLSLSNDDPELINKLLQKVGLEPKDYLDRVFDDKLSGGERKRIELAAVWALKPKLAILDEPDSGMDIVTLNKLHNIFTEMKQDGITLILITHREEVARLADKASLICDGLILQTGSVEEILFFYKNKCENCAHVNEIIKEEIEKDLDE